MKLTAIRGDVSTRAKRFLTLGPPVSYDLGVYSKDYLLQGLRFTLPVNQYKNALRPDNTRVQRSVGHPSKLELY